MATDSDIIEEKLQITLETGEFIDSLKKITGSYHEMIKRVSSLSADVGKGFVALNNQINNAVTTLSSKTSSSMQKAFGGVRDMLNATQKEARAFAISVEKDLEKIARLSMKQEGIKGAKSRYASSLKENFGEESEEYRLSSTQGILKRLEEAEKRAASKIKGIEDTSYKRLSELSVNAVKTATSTSEIISKTIISSSQNAINALSNLSKSSGKVAKDIEDAFANKKIPDTVAKQYQQIGREVENLNKQRQLAQKAHDLALMSYEKQKNTQYANAAHERYQIALQEFNKITALQKTAETRYRVLGTTIAQVKTDTPARLEELYKGLKGEIKPVDDSTTQNLSISEQIVRKMIDSLAKLGNAGREEINALLHLFKSNDLAIDENIKDLKLFQDLMNKLGSLGVKSALVDAKGMKEGLEGIQKTKNSYIDAVETISKLSISGPLVGADKKFEDANVALKKLFQTANEGQKKVNNLLESQVHTKNLTDLAMTKAPINAIQSSAKQAEKIVKGIQSDILKYEKEFNEYSRKAVVESNNMKAQAYAEYANKIKAHLEELKAAEKGYLAILTKTNSELETSMSKVERRIQGKLVQNAPTIGGLTSSLEPTIKSLQARYEDITRLATRFGSANAESMQRARADVESLVKVYSNQKKRIDELISSLKKIQNVGSAETNQRVVNQINELQKLKGQYSEYAREVRRIDVETAKMAVAHATKSSKTMWATGWEYLRNFRWQVAGLIYLVNKAAMFINRSFLGVFEQISQFRRSVYAVTASVGLVMGQQFKESFDIIFKYSYDLANKLQAKAATTYASLEDMMMVTRSFAQAGIFPKTDEDIDRIATLATAVKVMTEGMANAGVQMRQEIMALIEGRQRVTDTVARAFKMQGINLKEEMAKWAAEGKNRLQGFAELLAPFAEVNKRISREYDAQVNNLKEMWSYIKRIAGEGLTLQIAKDIEKFVASLGKPGTYLTEFGESVVKSLRAALTVFYEVLKTIGTIGLSIFNTFSAITSSIGTTSDAIMGNITTLNSWQRSLSGILKTFVWISTAIRSAFYPLTSIAAIIETILLYVRALGKLAGGDLKGALVDYKAGTDAYMRAVKEYASIVFDLQNGLKQADSIAKNLATSFSKPTKEQEFLANEILKSTEFQTQLNNYTSKLGTIIDENKQKQEKYNDKIQEVKEGWFGNKDEGIGGFKEAIQNRIKAIEVSIEVTKRMQDNLLKNASDNAINEIEIVGVAFYSVAEEASKSLNELSKQNTEYIKNNVKSAIDLWEIAKNAFRDMKEGFTSTELVGSGLEYFRNEVKKYKIPAMPSPGPNINVFNQETSEKLRSRLNALKLEKDRANAALVEGERLTWEAVKNLQDKASGKTKKTLAEIVDQYMDFKDKLGAINPFEKLRLQYENAHRELTKLIEDNSIVATHETELRTEIDKKYWWDRYKLAMETTDKLKDLEREITGKSLSAYGELDSKFANIREKIEDMTREFRGQEDVLERLANLKDLMSNLYPIETQKIYLENQKKINDVLTDTYEMYLDYILSSGSIWEQQAAEVEKLKLELIKTSVDINQKINEEKGKVTSEGLPDVDWGLVSAYENQLETMRLITEEKMKDITNVFRKYKDEITGFFEELYAGMFDSTKKGLDWVKESFTNFLTAIQSKLNSELASETYAMLKNLISPSNLTSGAEQLKAAGITRVWVTNFDGKSIEEAITGNIGKVEDGVKDTNATIADTAQEGFSGIFGRLWSGFKGMFSWISSGFGKVLSGLGSGLMGIFQALSGSSGGGFMSWLGPLLSFGVGLLGSFGGGVTDTGSGMMGTGDLNWYGKGGVINETIIGKGLRSGKLYGFGEDEDEVVTPVSKLKKMEGNKYITNNSYNTVIQAIEPQTFAAYLQKNKDTVNAIVVADHNKNGITRRGMRS